MSAANFTMLTCFSNETAKDGLRHYFAVIVLYTTILLVTDWPSSSI